MKKNLLLPLFIVCNEHIKEHLRIMKISVLLLFVAVFQLFATNTEAQNAVIHIPSGTMSVEKLIQEIEKQTDYLVIFSKREVDTSREVNTRPGSGKVSDYLSKAFDNTDVRYEFENNYILLSKNASPKPGAATQQKGHLVRGKVTDENGEPVIGANVIEKGTTNGTVTDVDGNFSLTVAENKTLQVSYIGYREQEIAVGSKSVLNIKLTEDTENLEEVVVVGYGVQKKVNLTGAVETIKSEKIVSKPVTTLQEALAGEASGMTVRQQSGQPGKTSASIRIRGIGTWENADPLVLVDGIAMSMDAVVPTDVESISVLKDASSAAIYGSRAANGVILITTKKGKQGKVSVSYSGSVGVQTPTRTPEMATSWQYAELYNQSMANSGKTSSLFPADRIERMKAGGDPDKLEGSTDWFKEVLHSAVQHSHNITIQGGGEKTSYVGSLGYTMQDGVIFSSYERYNARLNTTTEFTKWFKLGMNLSYINDQRSESAAGASAAYYYVPRALPYMPVKFSDGTWSFLSAPKNPVRMATDEYGMQHLNYGRVSTLITPEFRFFDGLEIKGIFGYESNTSNDKKFQKTVLYDAFEPAGQASNLFVARNKQTDKWEQYNNLTASATVSYEKTLKKHYFKVLGGGSLETFKYKWTEASRMDFPNNDFSEINAGDPNTAYSSGNSTYSSLASVFGRVNYSFADRYLFEANIRYDGSSKFADGHRWGLFPSFSVGWRVSEEAFFAPLKSYVQNFKLRASWGQLGNQQIKDYQSLSTFGSGNAYLFGNAVYSGYKEAVLGNPDITWETSTNWNIGADFSVLDSRLTASFDWYKRLTDDILLALKAPDLLGMTPALSNAGSVENKGWELTLGWRDQIGSDFHYSVGFNLSDVRNKITDLKGYKSPTSDLTIRIEGEPIDALYGWETLGICQNQEQYEQYKDLMTAYNGKWNIGDLIINDRDNDGKITAADKMVIGNQIPRFCYGINLGFDYKNFDFSCFFQGVGKANGFLGRDVIEPLGIFTALKEHYTDSFDPAHPTSDAYYPRVLGAESRHNYDNYSHWVQDASYLRLKNIQLGYTFSFPKANIEKLRLMVSGQNLFTLTNFRVYDPEAALNDISFPNVSVYSFGVNLTF